MKFKYRQQLRLVIATIVLIVAIVLVTPMWFPFTIVPKSALENITLVYRSVEPTGAFGTAQYYFFDKEGNRYHVSQTVFDSRIDLPRE